MKKYNIIFIGAGVSNLMAANRLLDYSINDFIILEKGKSLKNRKCIAEKELTCAFCKNGCQTIEGVGGSNAIHGNKLCYFPASNHVTKFLNKKEKNSILNYINDLLFPYFDVSFNSDEPESITNFKKNYKSDVLSSIHFLQMVEKLTNNISNKLITNSNVIKIEKVTNGFLIETDLKNKYYCEKLVLGTGRTSHKQLMELFDKLNVKYNLQKQDIGIRIETHKDNFSKEYYYQVDPKFKFNWTELGEGRTFCAHNQGYVVPVRFGNSFFADGAFGNSFGEKNNIALMVRTNTPLQNNKIENWCYELNKFSNNKLVLGEIDLKIKGQNLVNQILKLIPTFPTFEHKELFIKLLEKLFIYGPKILKDNTKNNSKLIIYGPAIDRYWVSPVLNNNFSTKKHKNLFVIGDVAGVSRGFVQAMFSGVYWADKLFAENITIKRRERWLDLV